MEKLLISQIITLILLIVSEILPFIKREDVNGILQGVSVLLASPEPPKVVNDIQPGVELFEVNDQDL